MQTILMTPQALFRKDYADDAAQLYTQLNNHIITTTIKSHFTVTSLIIANTKWCHQTLGLYQDSYVRTLVLYQTVIVDSLATKVVLLAG